MRAVFFGTPALAIPSLRALFDVAEIAGVVTQPDRPSGRGLRLQPTPVKAAALELGLEVFQPAKVRDGSLLSWLSERQPDVALVIAYGRILPPDVLAAPRAGCLNLHASLLPKLRGAAPIQWAIIRGEVETGISLMRMDEGLDTGPVLSRHATPILPDETAGELAERLASLAADVVRHDLGRAVAGELPLEKQDDSQATLAPPLERNDGRVSFSASPEAIARLVRGLAPRPGAFTSAGGKLLRLLRVEPSSFPAPSAEGVVRVTGGRPYVSAAGGVFEIVEAQLEGKRAMSGADLVNGRMLSDGQKLGEVRP